MEKGTNKNSFHKTYRQGLDTSDRTRYEAKLEVISGLDPYDPCLKWSDDELILPSVTYPDIVNYLLFTPSRFKVDDLKAWKSLEAVNQLCHGWVRDRTALTQGEHVVVLAKVMHSQKLREKPLRPWVIAKQNGVVTAAHCNCMAGLGEACTHVAALLFSIMVTVEIRDSSTVTETRSYWLQPKAMKAVQYKEVSEINFTSKKTAMRKLTESMQAAKEGEVQTPATCTPVRKTSVPEPTEAEFMSFCEKLSTLQRKPVLLATVEPFAVSFIPKMDTLDLPLVLQELRDSDLVGCEMDLVKEKCANIQVTCSEAQAANVEVETRLQSGNPLWFKFRAGRITASKAKAVCSTKEDRPSPSLVKTVCYPEMRSVDNDAMRWGRDNENAAREEAADILTQNHEELNVDECGFFISSDKAFMGASPDGLVTCSCCGTACLEVKCPFNARNNDISAETCEFLQEINGKTTLKKNHPYHYQVQVQMGVTGHELTYFVVWTTRDLYMEEIAFDKDMYDEVCMKAERFFTSAVLPELVGKVFTTLPVDMKGNATRTPLSSISNENVPASELENVETRYCVCDQVEFGDMVACDNDTCEMEWFHYGCVNIVSAPVGKWYCPQCRKLPAFKRRRLNLK